jgi:DNA-binding response OmpR family regulator
VAALAYGASGFMTKPFKPEKLVESVQAVLGL